MTRGNGGFSLIELMVTIAVLAIMLLLGMPTLTSYLQNQKLRGTVENFLSGIQLAHSEAVKQNLDVDFVFTNDDPVGADKVTAAATVNGRNWQVRTATVGNPQYIEGKLGAEGAGVSSTGTSPITVSSNGLASIRFNGLGQMKGQTTPVLIQFANPNGGDCASAGGPMRCLNILVSPGGQIKLCDPALSAAQIAARDSRACR